MWHAPASPSQEKDHRWKQGSQVIAEKARTGSSFPKDSGNSLADGECIKTFSLVIFELHLYQCAHLEENSCQLSPDGAEQMGKENSSCVCDVYYSSVSSPEVVGHGRSHYG